MDKLIYLNHLAKVFSNNFHLEINKILMNKRIDIYGVWNMKFGRNFISENKIIDEYECNEHCLVVSEDRVDEKFLDDFINYLKKCTLSIVNPHKNHKTTYITGILVTKNINDEDIMRKIKRFNYTKNYRMSLYGWSILRLIVVDLNNGEIYHNKISIDIVDSLSFDKVNIT